jgi:pyridoxamine 5'-phosphate oxidase
MEVPMDKKEVFDFINAHTGSHLATIDGNVPRVRGMGIHKADENGIIIQTAKIKDVYKQLISNPNVELCFNDYENRVQIRVHGKAELVNDPDLMKEVLNARPFLKSQIDEYGSDVIVLFRVKNGRAVKWTMAMNLKPKEWVDL